MLYRAAKNVVNLFAISDIKSGHLGIMAAAASVPPQKHKILQNVRRIGGF
jgi:hypothetical protein